MHGDDLRGCQSYSSRSRRDCSDRARAVLRVGMPLTESPSTASELPPPAGGILDRKQLDFLATKLVAPRCEGLIPRPRLLDMASQLSGKKLAVIKGPAGFGKTSLATAWSRELQQSGNAVGWLTIDPDDNEPQT